MPDSKTETARKTLLTASSAMLFAADLIEDAERVLRMIEEGDDRPRYLPEVKRVLARMGVKYE